MYFARFWIGCLVGLTLSDAQAGIGFSFIQPSGIKGTTLVRTYGVIPIDGGTHAFQAFGPLGAQIEIYSTLTGRQVTTVRSDTLGRFRVSLPAGRYRLVPKTI